MTNTENANAVMASRKVVIADLIRKLQEQVAALPDGYQGRLASRRRCRQHRWPPFRSRGGRPMNETIKAPAREQAPRTREQQDAARFGTIGFDLYRAAVLAESARIFAARQVQS